MAKSKKELINNALSKLKNVESIKKIELNVYLKDWSVLKPITTIQKSKKYKTKREAIESFCRKELFNRHSIDEPMPCDLSLNNIDYIELKEIKEEKKCKQYKTHDYITNAELNRMCK